MKYGNKSHKFTSIYLFALIVYRWNFNCHHRQRISLTSVSLFDNSISLLLIGNIYLIFIVYSATWLSILVHTVTEDFSIFETFLYLGDSIACRVRVAMIFFLASVMFYSFLLQALWCLFKVIFHSTLHTKKLCYLSLDHMFTYILLKIQVLNSYYLCKYGQRNKTIKISLKHIYCTMIVHKKY
jgi:hypothetical protein